MIELYRSVPLIDDDDDPFVNPANVSKGRIERDYTRHPIGFASGVKPFNLPLIPRSSWDELIEEAARTKSRISDFCDAMKVPVKNQQSTNYCFPAGTLVRMADGTHKPIEKICVLDRVVTAEGNIGRVMKSVVHEVSEPLVCLKMWGHSHLKATSEHPILTQRGYVAISQLKIGDKVALTKFAPQTEQHVQTGDFLYERNTVAQSRRKYRTYNYASSGGSRYSAGIPGKTQVTITRHPVPDVIHLTPQFGRISGFYLAEGHTSPCAVFFSFNASEKDTLAAECAALIRETLGCEPHVRVRKTVCQVTIHGANWSKLFDAMFGRGSDGKHLCGELASGPLEFLKNVLSGWMDGDRKVGESAVTVSRQLALNMFDIANVLGMRPILTTHQYPKIGNDNRWRKHSWMVGWANKGNVNHGTEQDGHHLWRTVRGIEQEEFKGCVFNIEVEGDNSYVAEGIGVHNCWINAPVHCLEIIRAIQGQQYVELSPASVGAKIKNFQNEGGWGTEGLQYLVETGCVPSAQWPSNAIDRKYDKASNNALRDRYRVGEWLDLPAGNFDAVATCLLLRIPVAIGLNWWGHEVTAIDLVKLDGKGRYGALMDNSWGADYGDNGRVILTESKATPDDAVAATSAVAS